MKLPKKPPEYRKIRKTLSNENKSLMFEYMDDEKINEFITDMNSRYLHWDEFTYRTPPNNANKELIWMLMKFNRNSTSLRLKISDEKGFLFLFNILDDMQQKLHKFDMDLGGTIGSSKIIHSEEKNRYLISSLMEESIASSQLEGASTTRKIAKDMLKSTRKPRDKSEKMILNNYLTAKMIKDSKVRKLTPEFILTIHANITKDTLEDKNFEGSFRNNDDVKVVDTTTGEIAYSPPEYKLIRKLIEEVCDFINNPDSYFIHPIIKASILHFLIGYVHPFEDGNGRTARSLFYWYLSKEGYWIIEFMSISRVILKSPIKYARAYLYTETDENDLTYFLNYQLRTMGIALNELRTYVSRKIKEEKELFKIIENIEGINIRQASILYEFHKDQRKKLTIKEVQEVFDVVYETARKNLLELEEKGFLKRKIMGKKQIIFLRSKKFKELITKKIPEIN